MSRALALVRFDARLTARNGEQLLLVLGIPVLILVFFSLVDVLPTPTEEPVDFLTPGVLALAVLSTAFANLAIAVGFEREYGALRRLGTTPLRRRELVAAKVALVVVIEAVQATVLVGAGLALGWRPDTGGVALAVLAALVASVAFAGGGLLLAGTLPGLVVLAVANALFVVLLLVSGLVVPLAEYPDAVAAVARWLPSTALGEILQGALRPDEGTPARAWVVLVAWALLLPPLAASRFRWESSAGR